MKPLDRIPEVLPIRISRVTMRALLQRLKNKAPGHDNILNVVVKNGGSGLRSHLKYAFELCLATGYIPPDWKMAIVVPILKEGKDGRVPESYRPVSLLPAFAKLLESLVAMMLSDFLENNNLLPEHQFGFRRRRGAVDPLFRLISDAALAMSQHGKLVAVFLDFKAAFDTVWHSGLKHKLKAAGVPDHLVRWTANFLDDRSFRVRVGSELSEQQRVKCGVPQGSPLSPLLFIFYCAEMQPLTVQPDDGRKSVGAGTYADDAANWAWGPHYEQSVSRLQLRLRSTESWCARWRLELNPLKCESIIIGHHGSSSPTVLLTIAGQRIPQVNEVKYLGVTLTTKLSWDRHLDRLSAKTKPRAASLYGIASRNVLPVDLCIRFSRVLIDSVLSYGAPAWFCMSKSTELRLFGFQVHGLRAAMNLPFECDPFGVVVEAGVEAISDVFQKALTRYADRCLCADNTMKKYIEYVASQQPDGFAMRKLEQHCPAWHVRKFFVPAKPDCQLITAFFEPKK